MYFPIEEIQEVSRQSLTYFLSLPLNTGCAKEIRFLVSINTLFYDRSCHDRVCADNGPGSNLDSREYCCTNAQQDPFTYLDAAGDGRSRCNMGEGPDQAVMIDGSVRVDDRASAESRPNLTTASRLAARV